VFDATGKKLFEGTKGEGKNGQGPITCVADLNGDGRPELIAGRTAYTFTGKVANNTFVGSTLWNSRRRRRLLRHRRLQRRQEARGHHRRRHARSTPQRPDRRQARREAPIPNGGSPAARPTSPTSTATASPEVAAAGSSQYIVYKFAGGATFTKLWSAPTDDTSSQVTGSSVFDFDGDGRNEVVYNDEVYIRIYPGQSNPTACSTRPARSSATAS
jgi:hypothetical protein